MKKFFSLFLIGLIVVFGLIACGETSTEASTTTAAETTTTAAETTTTTTVETTTEEVTTTKETFTSTTAYLAYAASDWAVSYWGPTSDGNTAGVVASNAEVTEFGTQYTVSLDLSAVTANGFVFLDLEIANGESIIPDSFMTIDEVSINGTAVESLGATYTTTDNDTDTRTNLYNAWVSTDTPVVGRTADGRYFDISATPLDISSYTTVTSISVKFTLVHGYELAPVAYLQFADSNWGEAQAWFDASASTNVAVDDYGQYTVGLDFTGTTDGYAVDVAFFDLEIANGEVYFPGCALVVDSIVINGISLAYGLTYTTTDNDNDTRVNLYNSWVGEIEAGRTADGIIEGISAVPLSVANLPQIETIEVTFTLTEGVQLGEVWPVDLPTQGTTAYLAVSDSGWSVGYWGTTSGGNTDGIVASAPLITGYGTYTTSLDFTGVSGAVLPDIVFLGLEVINGELYFPYSIVTIDSMSIDGVDVTSTLGNSYTTSDNGTETRLNIYNTWVSEITGNRFADGLTLEDVTATPLDGTLYTNISTISVTFTITEGEFYMEENDEFAGYEPPTSFNAFMMFSDTGGIWENYASGTSGDVAVTGDGVYEVSLTAADAGATGQAVAGQVFLIDIEGLGKAMRYYGTMDDENNTDLVVAVRVFIDGVEVTVNNSNIIVGDIEGNDRLRIELYNTWGAGTADAPVVDPSLLTPSSSIVVWFTLVGTGINTGADTTWPDQAS